MEIYWLVAPEYTLGFYSSIEECERAVKRYEVQEGMWEEGAPCKLDKVDDNRWTDGGYDGYNAYLITSAKIDTDLF